MPFVKVIKNKAYFKQFTTKLRRRREGKTDYKARRRLVIQDRNKYNSPKYRLVVRVTNTNVICQIISAKMVGDQTLACAYSKELTSFGAKAGLTNYAACYATGLLLARRLLTKLGLDKKYSGVKEADGKVFEVTETEDGPRAFKAVLDVGLARTTTGARVFGALKGAVDGGLNIPHSASRFPGWNKEKSQLDSEKLRQRIFGTHIAEYQRTLMKEDQDRYKQLFSKYSAAGLNPDGIVDMWKKVHTAIRANPIVQKQAKKPRPVNYKPKAYNEPRNTTTQRLHRRSQKLAKRQRLAEEAAQEKRDAQRSKNRAMGVRTGCSFTIAHKACLG
jgi:large subunit ribosomal protein L5e